jgi:exonuclease SbcC
MKFTKVEIQAFRAYDKVKDGTFDFTRKDGRSADFISLYAPNGFGKTSFYDAVEFGITNNIDRFLRKGNGKETFNSVKSERNIRSNKKQYFLRNNNSDENLPSFIKLYTIADSSPIEKKIRKPKTKAGYDYKFDPNTTENKEFKTVILSQEWIDAFLKEDKPEDRYETFIDYFGDKKIDDYFNKLKNLITLNNKRIEALTKELKGIQLELKFEGDKNILKKVNEQINLLNKEEKHLKEINESFSETDAINLANKISERTIDLGFEINKLNESTKHLDILLTGNQEAEGAYKYFDSKEKVEQLDKEYKEYSSILEKFNRRQECENEIRSIKNQNIELGTKKQILESLKNDFKEYEKITQEISALKLEIEELKKESSNRALSLSTLKQNENENATKREHLQKQIFELEKNISEIPKLREDFTNAKQKISECQSKISEGDFKIAILEKEKSLLETTINNFQTSIQEIANGTYPLLDDEVYSNNAEIIDELNEIAELLTKEQESLNGINSNIKTSEDFQKEIEQLISKGSEIVNKNQTNICPLCEQQYESFNTLASKISNNSLLSNVLSGLLRERDDKNISISKLNGALESTSEKLVTKLTEQLAEKEKRRTAILADLKNISIQKSEIIKEREFHNKTLSDTILKINRSTFDEFEQESQSKLNSLKTEFDLHLKKNEELKNSILSESKNLEDLKNKSNQRSVTVGNLNDETIYLKIINHFKVNHPEKPISEKVLFDEIKSAADLLQLNADREMKLMKEINELSQTLNPFIAEDLQKTIELISKTKESLIKIINSFEIEVKSILNIDLDQYTIDLFSQLLEVKKKAKKAEINKHESIIKDYTLLSQLIKNVTPYLTYEKAKIKEIATKTRIDFLKHKIDSELKKELKNVTEHLTQQIDSFFYEGLINDLYRKIDPHPEYKRVTFKCDFSEAKPKLNVCVYQEKEDELIIPTLYFSTAQLNILSLSIFLAKALNAKDDKGNPFDCIFIDDPIQSMDSINILSTIDLIRSIVVNHKKQIILSTHDENFHNLLKKKMPSKLFNSKFMELETYGKVKNDSNNN